jgi:hypothetical protein
VREKLLILDDESLILRSLDHLFEDDYQVFATTDAEASTPGREWTMGNIARLPCDEAAILAGSCEHPVTTNGPWILAATILGSSMVFIDGTVVNVALPALQSALHATLADVQWVMESYALFLATLLLIGGSLGDLYGRRKILAAGVVLFSVASAGC